MAATSAQLEELSSEYASFRSSSEVQHGKLQRQLAAAEAECGRLAEARSAAADEVAALQQRLGEVQAAGTPKGNAAKQTVQVRTASPRCMHASD